MMLTSFIRVIFSPVSICGIAENGHKFIQKGRDICHTVIPLVGDEGSTGTLFCLFV